MHNCNCKPLPPLSQATIERFLGYIDKKGPDECWPWLGSLNKYGYPQFGADKIRRAVRGNRIAYFLHYGIDPFPHNVLHKCDFRACCNGAHYFLGSKKDNADDRDAKGRTAKGTKIACCKLNEDQVRQIRKNRADGATYSSLGEEFGVDRTVIFALCNGRTWKHVK